MARTLHNQGYQTDRHNEIKNTPRTSSGKGSQWRPTQKVGPLEKKEKEEVHW